MVQLPTRTILTRRALSAFAALVFAGLLLALCSGPALADTTFTVKNVKNGGPGSLRSAIQKANAALGEDTIRFRISGGLDSISPRSPLPPITEQVTIDGYTQRGARPAPAAVLKIRINGARAGVGANGLEITANNSTIRGLVINRFKASGILAEGDGNKIEGNYIGTDQTGTLDHANGKAGVRVAGGSNNAIGGNSDPAQPNLISHNLEDSVQVDGPLATGNSILSNRIYDNHGLGIDLGDDGVTPNDATPPPDSDTGPNNLQNFPVLTSATKSGDTTTITGTLSSTPNRTFTVQCFATGGEDASGQGEGRTLLDEHTDVMTAANGGASFSCTSDVPAVGDGVSATATNTTTNDTSEFSLNRTVE